MSFRGDRPVPLPRTRTMVRKPLPKQSAVSQLSPCLTCQENSRLQGDEQNSDEHNPVMSRNEQKMLQEENVRLKCELKDLRSQYDQLAEEGKNECFDERRVNLLKAQILQLERQVVLLRDGLSSRAAVMLECHASLEVLMDKLSSFCSTEGATSEEAILHSELLQTMEICQAMRQNLQRNQQTSDITKLALPWNLGKNFITQPMTLLDVCYSKTENLNLRYVSALEGKLSKLWKHLLAMRQNLSFILAPGQMSCEATHHILPTAVYARLINHAARCHRSVEECCSDLLTLTLLVPSAPWEVLEHSLSQEFTVENVLATLPAFPKGAPQQRAKRAVEALVKAQNYSRQMAMQQIFALQAELNFHRDVYNLQVKYIESVFDGIKQAYHIFQDNVAMVLCSPLQDVFSSYTKLKTEASETALRHFLIVFRNNAEQIQDAVEALSPPMKERYEGDEALSRFGKEFFLSLERSLKACGEQRDKAASETETLQLELDQALETLRNLREQKTKKAASKQHFPMPDEEKVEASGLDVFSPPKCNPDSVSKFPVHKQKLLSKLASANEKGSINPPSKQNLESSHVQQKGKSLHRSKPITASARPAWQDSMESF